MKKYIEPRLRRDFGGIISAYFDFLKGNVKEIVNMFIGYNGVFVIFLLISTYMVVTGAVALTVAQNNTSFGSSNPEESAAVLTGLGFIFWIIIILIATLLNYSLSSAYVSLYEQRKMNNIPRKDAWHKAKRHLGGLFLVALTAVGLYFIYVIVQLVLAFIPLLGSIASIFIGLGFNAWISLTIFSYVHNEDSTVFAAFGEAWELLFSSFWKAIGVNFVLGLIIQVCLFAINIVPSILVGVYIFHTIDTGTGLDESVFGQILIVVLITLFSLIIMFIQLLSQTINAFVYFNLHEFKNNTFLRSRIEKLGDTA
ncbi:MAG: hypothetical protein ACSHWW_06205 [Nonlabens sp.]|uniref:hypothetical protein n=1 Tax=Nonlabens sp. TaxID=1888209 RepID=UPI003EF959EC